MTKIKICGITNLNDANIAAESGADALGFIFAESCRCVTPQTARDIALSLPPFISKIGVFVDEDPLVIQKIADYCYLDTVQLHGDKCRDYSGLLQIRIIRVFAVKGDSMPDQIRSRRFGCFMLDTYQADLHGGTGQTFNWQIAKDASKFGRVILSGGLNPDNISQALSAVQPYAVDVCSGVEKIPGVKDPPKIKHFIREVKNWDCRID